MMRKFIIGGLVGFTLSLGFGAHAEVVTMINKVVEGTFPVTVQGQKLDTDAVVIEGSTYLPVRAFGEAIGYDVKFDTELGVSLEPTASTSVPIVEKDEYREWYDGKVKEASDLKAQIAPIQSRIEELGPIIIEYMTVKATADYVGPKPKDELYYKTMEERDALTAQRDELEAKVKAIYAELAERAKQEQAKNEQPTQTP